MIEQWRPVPAWEAWYEVSSFGRVASCDRHVFFSDGRVRWYRGRELAQYEDLSGYKKVTLKRNGKSLRAHVHVLVAAAFLGPRPVGYEVCHADGNTRNPRLDNLRYDTRAGNYADTLRHGTSLKGRHPGAKISATSVALIRALRGKMTCRDLAVAFGTSPAHVCNIQNGKRR